MQTLIKKAVTDILHQLSSKHWQCPVYQLIITAIGSMILGRYNLNGSFEHLVKDESGFIEYPVMIRLIDFQVESVKAVVTKEGYEFSEN